MQAERKRKDVPLLGTLTYGTGTFWDWVIRGVVNYSVSPLPPSRFVGRRIPTRRGTSLGRFMAATYGGFYSTPNAVVKTRRLSTISRLLRPIPHRRFDWQVSTFFDFWYCRTNSVRSKKLCPKKPFWNNSAPLASWILQLARGAELFQKSCRFLTSERPNWALWRKSLFLYK